MDPIGVVIADDDHSSRKILQGFLQLLPQFEVIDEVPSGNDLITSVMKNRPDIVLVDIGMPGISGMDAVKTLRELTPSLHVIFTTGYDSFAVEAFDVSAVDYVVKPINLSRLKQALDKATELVKKTNEPKLQNRSLEKLLVKKQNAIYFISVSDVIFIERIDRKTIIHTFEENYESYEPLSEWEEKLGVNFYKAHRSYIVNLDLIERIESSGETYIAYFKNYAKHAYISKQKVNQVQKFITK
jgi:two-component system LytT family response regulator